MQGLKYFGNKSWADITREERVFCAELYSDLKHNPKSFIHFLNRNFETNHDIEKTWEVGFEVCFYRDYLFSKQKKVRLTDYSDKRTFDLCLFSDTKIIIIEAKADQKFGSGQLEDLKNDVNYVKSLLGDEFCDVEVVTYLLNSSHREKDIEGFKKFTWLDLHNLFNDNPIYLTADNLPLREKPNNF